MSMNVNPNACAAQTKAVSSTPAQATQATRDLASAVVAARARLMSPRPFTASEGQAFAVVPPMYLSGFTQTDAASLPGNEVRFNPRVPHQYLVQINPTEYRQLRFPSNIPATIFNKAEMAADNRSMWGENDSVSLPRPSGGQPEAEVIRDNSFNDGSKISVIWYPSAPDAFYLKVENEVGTKFYRPNVDAQPEIDPTGGTGIVGGRGGTGFTETGTGMDGKPAGGGAGGGFGYF